VSRELPNREQAIKILQENNCPTEVIEHCIAVADFAVELAQKIQAKHIAIDIGLVEAGALLHDLGRSKTHSVDHAVVGAQIAESLGQPQSVVNIVKRHVGAGITPQEAQQLGWPKDNYIPQTIEEKVVAYADKRIGKSNRVPIEREILRLKNDGKAAASERVRRLHEELSLMLEENQ
jgi:uncharacterized protein